MLAFFLSQWQFFSWANWRDKPILHIIQAKTKEKRGTRQEGTEKSTLWTWTWTHVIAQTSVLLCPQYKHFLCPHGQSTSICPMLFCYPSTTEFHFLTSIVLCIIWSLLKLFFQRPPSLWQVELCPTPPEKFICCISNPQYLSMWPYLEIGLL